MEKEFTILIADRNSHVRKFLKREMLEEGYRIRLAENGRDVLKWVYHHEPLDLLILDIDLPDVDELSLSKGLQDRIPALPVVVHTYLSDYDISSTVWDTAVFVEKKGNSVERLKKVIFDILHKPGCKGAGDTKEDKVHLSEIKYE